MKMTRSRRDPDALLEVDRGAAFLVHDADLDRVAGKSERILDAGEEIDRELHLLGAVHLGLDDVDAAGARVATRAVGRMDVVQRAEPP